MDKKAFWQQKVLQLLHDSPSKPFASYPSRFKTGGHSALAKAYLSALTGVAIKYTGGLPDFATGGADRPMVAIARKDLQEFNKTRESGDKLANPSLRWPDSPVLTHPLQPGPAFRIRLPLSGTPADIKEEVLLDEDGRIEDTQAWIEQNGSGQPAWHDAGLLHRLHRMLWRSTRAQIQSALAEDEDGAARRHLWDAMPADSRSPDHSIWDHTRLTSALAFITEAKGDDNARAPWLLRFALGPVAGFIEESRTSRDLWMSSFLVAELTWAAMEPFIERYGPDSVIYPDLRGNQRADLWLAEPKQNDGEALPDGDPASATGTYASIIPNAFTLFVPLGGQDYLEPLEALAARAMERVNRRWGELARVVRAWLIRQRGDGDWTHSFDAQNRDAPLTCTWSAIRWSRMPEVKDSEVLLRQCLPAQQEGPAVDAKDEAAYQEWCDRHRDFVSGDEWSRYVHARRVYLAMSPAIHRLERGFDYALTHHQLRIRHALRKQHDNTPPLPVREDGVEPGEKCTQCGKRAALYNLPSAVDINSQHRAARAFWNPPPGVRGHGRENRLNPDDNESDRLCGVCAVKRFLVEAGTEDNRLVGINPVWAGFGRTLNDIADGDRTARVPFPSTAAMAAQAWLANVCKALPNDPELSRAVADLVRDWQVTGMQKTGFPRALQQLGAAAAADTRARDLLMLDAQQSLFPQTLDLGIRQAEDADQAAKLTRLRNSVLRFRRRAATSLGRLELPRSPGTRIAVLRLDGDRMGKLLLGSGDAIPARWRDVIHPSVVEQLLDHEHAIASGWPGLLDQPRLMGPSLHAFISRALAGFAHRIVPWVVEREFPGRLIYAGGDDVLAMAPADDAIAMAARLQQLFSAPWILDIRPEASAWDGRHGSGRAEWNPAQDRLRFQVPRAAGHGEALTLPFGALEVFSDEDKNAVPQLDGELLPMLGHGASLSAGIAFGHYKTSLRGLLRQSKHLLETVAKDRLDRRAIAVSHFSRGGLKNEFGLKWDSGKDWDLAPDPDRPDRILAHRWLQVLIDGYRAGHLPKRLPYKLTELRGLLDSLEATGRLDDRSLLQGLFNRALEGTDDSARALQAREVAMNLWIDEVLDRRSSRAADPLVFAARFVEEASAEEEMQ